MAEPDVGLPMWWMGEEIFHFRSLPIMIIEGSGEWLDSPNAEFWLDTDDKSSRLWSFHVDEDGKLQMVLEKDLPALPVGDPHHEMSDGWTHLTFTKCPTVPKRWFARLWRRIFGHPSDMKLYIDGELWRGKWHDRATRLFRFITRRYPDELSWRGPRETPDSLQDEPQ